MISPCSKRIEIKISNHLTEFHESWNQYYDAVADPIRNFKFYRLLNDKCGIRKLLKYAVFYEFSLRDTKRHPRKSGINESYQAWIGVFFSFKTLARIWGKNTNGFISTLSGISLEHFVFSLQFVRGCGLY
jgi:hypothetical protein